MYLSTTLASQTLTTVNRIMGTYDELQSVCNGITLYLSRGGDDAHSYSGYAEKERREHLIRCINSLEKTVKELAQLYPGESLHDAFQRTLDGIQELYRLLSENDFEKLVYIPGVNLKAPLESRIRGLGIFQLVSSIPDYLQSMTPLSGHQAKLITIALLEQNAQAAIQQIFILFEDRLRKRIGAGPDLYGENLINRAFGKDGALKYGDTLAEQAGVRNLFSGVYAVFRNPRMHRTIEDDHKTVLAIITTVDLLIKIIDEAQDVT